MSSRRHANRLAMGSGAVFSVQVAAELLPGADGVTRRWLYDNGLVRRMAGRPVVVWADVLDALREPDERPKPKRDPLPRMSLD